MEIFGKPLKTRVTRNRVTRIRVTRGLAVPTWDGTRQVFGSTTLVA